MTLAVSLIGGHALGRAVFSELLTLPDVDVRSVCSRDEKLVAEARYLEIRTQDEPGDPEADLGVMVHHTAFLQPAAVAAHRVGVIGYHPSLLPRHRGGDAVEWTIRMRDPVAGGSVFQVTGDVDGGPVLAQAHCFVLPGDDARSLWRRDLLPLGVRLISSVVSFTAAHRGTLPSALQLPEEAATWEPALRRARLSDG